MNPLCCVETSFSQQAALAAAKEFNGLNASLPI